ncbi:hypothetical protein EDC01DRAFT_649864 [Geopyxis carbonaria]|nr:hypothetical protein EDC01DRAFT_649864 [Geopyxis carbonaria]
MHPIFLTPLLQIAQESFPAPAASTSAASTSESGSQSTVPDNPSPSRESSTLGSTTTNNAAPSPYPSLHPTDAANLAFLITTITETFPSAPPHTVQRLAELLRSPTAHYTQLCKFLRACQRVVSVSSTSLAFPLHPDPTTTGAANGTLGSDEALGGALLTPITWLAQTNGGSMEAVAGVSQGELLRQEQELNIVPAAQIQAHGEREGRGEEQPPGIGAEDVGPQPEGTVFPEPPRSPEDIGSPPPIVPRGIEEAVAEGEQDKDAAAEAEPKKDEEMTDAGGAEKKPEEQEKEEEAKTEGGSSAAAADESGDAMQVDDAEKENK